MQPIFRKFIIWIRFIAFGQFNQLGWVYFPKSTDVRKFSQRDPDSPPNWPALIEYNIPEQQAFWKVKHAKDFNVPGINFDDDTFNDMGWGFPHKKRQRRRRNYISGLMVPYQFENYCDNLVIFGMDLKYTVPLNGKVIVGKKETEAIFLYSKKLADRRVIFFYKDTKKYWSGWQLNPSQFNTLMTEHVLRIAQGQQNMSFKFKKLDAGDYSYQAYCELIQKEMQLWEEKKSLFDESPVDWHALLSYQARIFDQVVYNNRFNYLTLLKRYQENQTTSFGVECQFLAIYREDLDLTTNLSKNLEALADFEISSKSDGFGKIIDQLHGVCEIVSDPEYFLSEEEFDEYISQIISELELYS